MDGFRLTALIVLLATLAACLLAQPSEARTIVVDQGGTGEFKTVSAALASSRVGDVIFIKPGSYRDSLVLEKTLTINSTGASIDGLGRTVFTIKAPLCRISNLTIGGSDENPVVVMESEKNILTDCQIVNSSIGIVTGGDNSIVRNRISSTAYGIKITGSGLNVSRNSISGALGAGLLATANSSSIEFNQISDCNTGIDLVESGDISVLNNTITGSKIGIRAKSSLNNSISGNNCTKNEISGIYLEGSGTNELAGNVLEENGNGILMKRSGKNTLRGNEVIGNTYGISMKGSPNSTLLDNSMRGNSYNIRIETGEIADIRLLASTPFANISIEDFNQSIDRSNTADGLPICYLVGAADMLVDYRCGFVALIGCKNVTVIGQKIANNSVGVLLVRSPRSSVENCSIYSSETGISLLDSNECVLTGNLAESCNTGYWLGRSEDVAFSRNIARLCSESGIQLNGGRRSRISEGVASGNRVGISLVDSFSCEVSRCDASTNTEQGIKLIRSHMCTIKDNMAGRNSDGITLTGSNSCIVAMNNATMNSGTGFLLEQLSGGDVASNTAILNREGMHIQTAGDLRITGNRISENSRYGIRMSASSGCNLTDNRFERNTMPGVSLTDCSGNWIYHNMFIENGGYLVQNAVDNGENHWDAGPVSGGNFWSDHSVTGDPSSEPKKIPSRGTDRYPFESPGGWI